MKHVARHTLNSEVLRKSFARTAVSLPVLLERAPPEMLMQLSSYGQCGLDLIQMVSVFDREHPLLRTAARTLAQTRFGAVRLGGAVRQDPVEFMLGDRWITMEGTGPNPSSDVGVWTEGWYGALMARDSTALEGLRLVDSTTLRACDELDEYHYAWKDALVMAESQPEEALRHIERAIDLARPEHATIAMPGVPELSATAFPILRGIVQRDAGIFNDALASALEVHKAHWTDEPNDSRGWIALAPLALTCLAHDRGIPIEVESEFLLPAVIRGK